MKKFLIIILSYLICIMEANAETFSVALKKAYNNNRVFIDHYKLKC